MTEPSLADRTRKALHRWLKHDPTLFINVGMTAAERAMMHADLRREIAALDRAHRIVLSEDFARFVAIYSKAAPEVLARNLPSAILPHVPLWIEWPERTGRWPGLTPGVEISEYIASAVGLLIAQRPPSDGDPPSYSASIYYTNGTTSLDTPAAGFNFSIGEPLRTPEAYARMMSALRNRGRVSDSDAREILAEYDRALIGSGYLDGHGRALDDPTVRLMADRAFGTIGIHSEAIREMIHRVAAGTSEHDFLAARLLANKIEQARIETNADYRFMLAVLTCLNMEQRELRSDAVRSAGSVFVGGKIKPAYEYRIVHVVRPIAGLTEKQIARRVTTSVSAARRRWHTVEAAWHYRRSSGRPDCAHVYQPVINARTGEPMAHQQQRCSECGRLRWTVKSHARGDRSIGIIDKEKRISTTGRRHIEIVQTVATLPDSIEGSAP